MYVRGHFLLMADVIFIVLAPAGMTVRGSYGSSNAIVGARIPTQITLTDLNR
jgi:hypothetical protein